MPDEERKKDPPPPPDPPPKRLIREDVKIGITERSNNEERGE